MFPGSWSVARKTQNNRGFVQRRDWVPPGTEKQLLMGQQDFLFLHKAIQLTVQNINLMARYGSNREHSRVPLCSSIPRDASVCMGKESHILSCRVKRSAHGCCQAASALLWKEAFISMPSDQGGKKNPKQKKALLLLPERSPSLVPCVEQVVDMVAFIVYGEKLNSSKWVILVCFNFVNSLPTQYPKSISSHWQKVSQFCAWWIEFQYILQKFPFCKDCVVVFKWMGGFKKSWRLSKRNEIC